ncbi:MAG: disulfide bond formation protein DsbA [Verrucomicrobiales bacterium]|nr:disulfide bond formation protein DsbA [Verrucomicrobiales bacterium]
MKVTVTYYLEVISSWCYWAEPAWAQLKSAYQNQPVEFQWKLALMEPSAFPASKAQCDWFYQRSGTIVRSPFLLNSGWFEPDRQGYPVPNLVAEAARSLGIADDRVRLALAEAAVRQGQKVGRWEVAVSVAAQASGLAESCLLQRAQARETADRVQQSTAEFHDLKVSQRPTFLLENNIGDRAVFSGLVKLAPLSAALDALLQDAAAYASHAAHFGAPPSA